MVHNTPELRSDSLPFSGTQKCDLGYVTRQLHRRNKNPVKAPRLVAEAAAERDQRSALRVAVTGILLAPPQSALFAT